jgi:hypothetical protein
LALPSALDDQEKSVSKHAEAEAGRKEKKCQFQAK